jgi:hypothetical protein
MPERTPRRAFFILLDIGATQTPERIPTPGRYPFFTIFPADYNHPQPARR